jgi:signal transduction histidine kinase
VLRDQQKHPAFPVAHGALPPAPSAAPPGATPEPQAPPPAGAATPAPGAAPPLAAAPAAAAVDASIGTAEALPAAPAARAARQQWSTADQAVRASVTAAETAATAAQDASTTARGAARAVRVAKSSAGAAGRVAERAARAAEDLAASVRRADAGAAIRARLEATTEALREAARVREEFLGTVAHELRTPLQVAAGYAELLRMQLDGPGPGPSTGELAERIVESTFQMASMLDDLLDFAAAGQGRLTVRPLDVDLTPVLRTVAISLTPAPGAERLTLDLPPAAPAHADPIRIAQVTTNLLTNALKYAPEGPVTLRARKVKSGVRVAVLDQGPGIPQAERRRVWEKYYRGAAACAGAPPGTGIGLAVVKALVEAHGGRVGLICAPGRGSRFWFELPAATGS